MLVVFLPVLLVLIELRFRRWPYHVFEAVRPTSGPVIISGMIYRRHVQYAVEEGLLKSNVRNHTDYQSYFFLSFFLFVCFFFYECTYLFFFFLYLSFPNIIYQLQVCTGTYRLSFVLLPIYLLSLACFSFELEGKRMIIKSKSTSCLCS